MNLDELHIPEKPVSALTLFKGDGQVISLRIKKGEQLKEHVSKVPAILICVNGEAMYSSEKNEKLLLKSGDYLHIEPLLKHWVDAIQDATLILVK